MDFNIDHYKTNPQRGIKFESTCEVFLEDSFCLCVSPNKNPNVFINVVRISKVCHIFNIARMQIRSNCWHEMFIFVHRIGHRNKRLVPS